MSQPQPSMFDLSTTAPLPDGVVYLPNWLDEQDEHDLLVEIDEQAWTASPTGRRHQRYGSARTTAGEVDMVAWPMNSPTIGVSVIGFLGRLAHRLDELIGPGLATMTVMDYPAGLGFTAVADPKVSSPIVTVSLSSPAELYFRSADGSTAPFLAERRSLLVIAPEVRQVWDHGMEPRETDSAFGVVRRRRVTISSRVIAPG